MSESIQKGDFEQIINRSYDLAVKFKNEYVVLEHVLISLLEFSSIDSIITSLGSDAKMIKKEVEDFITKQWYPRITDGTYQPKYTTTLLGVIKQAKAQSMFMGKTQMSAIDMLLAIFNVENSWSVYFLHKHNITKTQIVNIISQKSESSENLINADDARALLSQYATNLNQRASNKKLNPLIGREPDINLLVENLARKLKNNVLLVGHSGVGKTQLVEGLAQRIVNNQVPKQLINQEIWNLDLTAIVAGTKFRGDFEERMKNLISAIKVIPNCIIFIDEIHMLLGAGGGNQGNNDAANMLKPALGRGEIRTIGSTTYDEYRKYFEKDKALLRRFQKQDVLEPSVEDTKKIVKGLIKTFSEYHQVSYDTECIDGSVDLSMKYIFNRHLPDKAIDLIDAAGAAVKVRNISKTVTLQDLQEQVAKVTKMSIEKVDKSNSEKLAGLDTNLKSVVFGQNSAIDALSDAVWLSYSGLREQNKTIGSFLFTGPSGTGKCLAGDQKITIRVTKEFASLLDKKSRLQYYRMDMLEERTVTMSEFFSALEEYELLNFIPNSEQFINTPVYIQNENSEWIPVIAAITKNDVGVKLHTSNNEIIHCANKHRLIVDGKSTSMFANEIKIGQILMDSSGNKHHVTQIEHSDDTLFYDVTVDSDTHLYQTTNGFVHHNTELSKQLASIMGYTLVRFNMSEFQEKHTVSRFIGSPPGYVGYSDGDAGSGALINALEQNPSCVLLIDEVEKAHPEVLNIFLQAMDQGEITSQNQKSVSLKNVILIFTSNLGAVEMERQLIGFGRGNNTTADKEAVQRFFAPEFRNRLDATIAFLPLSKDTMMHIVDKFVTGLEKLSKDKDIRIVIDPKARAWLADKGYDPSMGARPLTRVIDSYIKKPLSKEILFGKLVNGGSVLVTVDESESIKLEILKPTKQSKKKTVQNLIATGEIA